jgi:hypothetical protein
MGSQGNGEVCTVGIVHYQPSSLSNATYEMGFRAAVELLEGKEDKDDKEGWDHTHKDEFTFTWINLDRLDMVSTLSKHSH